MFRGGLRGGFGGGLGGGFLRCSITITQIPSLAQPSQTHLSIFSDIQRENYFVVRMILVKTAFFIHSKRGQ